MSERAINGQTCTLPCVGSRTCLSLPSCRTRRAFLVLSSPSLWLTRVAGSVPDLTESVNHARVPIILSDACLRQSITVIPLPIAFDLLQVLSCPNAQRVKRFSQRLAEIGKGIFDRRRDGRVDSPAVIFGLARGNVYSEGSPVQSFEHAETLLRSIFAFLGAKPEFIIAEGIGRGEEARQAALNAALTQAHAVA